jgi:hypothetical protein
MTTARRLWPSCAAKDPGEYAKLIAASVRDIKIEVSHTLDAEMREICSEEELIAFVAERGGPQAAEAFKMLVNAAKADENEPNDGESNVIELRREDFKHDDD